MPLMRTSWSGFLAIFAAIALGATGAVGVVPVVVPPEPDVVVPVPGVVVPPDVVVVVVVGGAGLWPFPLFTPCPCEPVLTVVVGALPPVVVVVVVVVLFDELLTWGLPPPFEGDPFDFPCAFDVCGLP